MLAERSWARGRLLGFDTETTGVDVETDRVVSAALIEVTPGRDPVIRTWLIDPGVEIPEAAIAVHGISTERARQTGRRPAEALSEIYETLTRLWTPEVPLITFNGAYDLSIMDREGLRHLAAGLDITDRYMVDGLIIDREVDRYRKGSRKLDAVCRCYGVVLGAAAHHADADTLAAMRLAWKIAARYPAQVGNVALPELHANQRQWHRQWGARMAQWLREQAETLSSLWINGQLAQVRARLAKLDITDELTADLIAQVCKETRQRADEFAAAGVQWPLHPRPSTPTPRGQATVN
jgi:DNA polymerase-3 subunit epsilon